MELICYELLSTRSKRAIARKTRRFGRRWNKTPYEYRPRGTLIVRLARELGWTEDLVWEQIEKERKYFMSLE